MMQRLQTTALCLPCRILTITAVSGVKNNPESLSFCKSGKPSILEKIQQTKDLLNLSIDSL